ncbi:GNAT family N-acetyltransferase [Rhodobacter sp. Har01]|uniref:GNAT family N-acetyltransferase n=1 Tax=Rhodobacter sp. Har01 TaxID=2883999 RepID=UPI001D06870C|nr:GNAT family N-acetyltransferase [Rhodobacter sp. Har01]MCB6179901.1 GNAT family N-acetyltransferase [Rhodobacter sp. Har01]
MMHCPPPPHLATIPGPAADFAAALAAHLPRIETSRTVLRAPRLSDAAAWIAIMVPDTEGHLGGPHDEDGAFTEFAATVGLWLLRGHGLWTVTDHADRVLGFVLIGFEPGDQAPELGWLFLPEARGRGLATEAAAAARAHALSASGLPELVSYIDPTNVRSRRVAERLGARPAGTISDPGSDAWAEIWRHAPLPAETT